MAKFVEFESYDLIGKKSETILVNIESIIMVGKVSLSNKNETIRITLSTGKGFNTKMDLEEVKKKINTK